VAIAGPTGSGKSELALRVAREFPAEIVNCDSLQLYRNLDIGTAKLAPEERQGVPHHLLDVLEPDAVFTAGDYMRMARPVLAEIAGRGRLPLVVGGTGFYLRALLDGLAPGPPRDNRLRTRLAARERRRPGSLHRLLQRLDPPSAARIHANDANKLVRALEVCLLERQHLSGMLRRGRDPLWGFRPLKIALDPPREALYARLAARAAAMFGGGLVEEVRGILARGFPAGIKPFESLGYRQALLVISGRMTLEEAIESTLRQTRNYAKRQWTWFRKEPGIEWFAGFGSEENLQRAVLARVRAHLLDST
jgi:tRNA dimethylallyltransferase